MKTQKQIKLKSGEVLPKGLAVSFDKNAPFACFIHADRDEPFRVRVTAAFQSPSMEELEEAVCDGVCESVSGEQVEPDGWDQFGSPSWLLALGMI